MCGLVGIASNYTLSTKGEDFMQQALFADQLRGMDATGVALVNGSNEVSVFKKAMPASDFLDHKVGMRAMSKVRSSYIALGHNRATTIGASTTANAHPFDYGRIVGAHNGTIREHKDVFSVTDNVVDSENLIASLDKDGDVASTLAKVHSGAYALTAYDKEDQTLIFARNSKRPLVLLHLDDHLIWGSEMGLIHWVAIRNNLVDFDKNKGKIINVPEHTVLRFDTNEMKFLKRETYTPDSAPTFSGGGWGGKYNNANRRTTSKSSNNTVGSTHSTNISKVDFQGIKYDLRFDGADNYKNILQISDTRGWSLLPLQFKKYSTSDHGSNVYGSIHGLVYSPEEAAMFPATLSGIKEEEFEECMQQGCLIAVNLNMAYVSNKGNIETISVLRADNKILAENNSQGNMWEDPFLSAWNAYCIAHDVDYRDASNKESTYAGLSYNALKDEMLELNDSTIRKACSNARSGTPLYSTGTTTAKKQLPATASSASTATSTEDASKGGAEKKHHGNAQHPAQTVDTAAQNCSVSSKQLKLTDGSNTKEVAGTVVAGNFPNKNSNSFPNKNSNSGSKKAYQGPYGIVDESTFRELTEDGCSVCDARILYTDHEFIAWDNTDRDKPVPLCVHCTADFSDALQDATDRGEARVPDTALVN